MLCPSRLDDGRDYDVIVVGGSIAGSSTALMLLRENPGLRLLIVERLETLDRRVGESTVEFSTWFLTRELGLTRHLNENHLVKQGFRFWFNGHGNRCMGHCTEMGGKYLTRVTSFQVDRETLDKHVLDLAIEAGAELWRPASVRNVELNEGGLQSLTVKRDGQDHELKARWVVDATGRHAMLARRNDWLQPFENHRTNAAWARYRNTADFDGRDLALRYPDMARACFGMRHTATNHLMGDGWWAWIIPLKNGDTSIGVVWDEEIFDWPRTRGVSLSDQLSSVIKSHPVGAEVLKNAQWIEGDVHTYRNLPYVSKKFAGDGFALVGDAAGFIDPFYSMGLDAMSMTVASSVELINAQLHADTMKRPMPQRIARHNHVFSTSFRRWYDAIYRDKYHYMGDYELMRIAFVLEVGSYYLGIVMQPYKRGRVALTEGMFVVPPAVVVFWCMRLVTRRLAKLARVRRRRGTFGRRNTDQRWMAPGFAFDTSVMHGISRVLLNWLKLELTEGWRSWFRRVPLPTQQAPDSAPMASPATS